jgi:Fe-S-cluster containining protein
MTERRRLQVLFAEVATRASALGAEHPGWPCMRGCGACCRALARVPELTRAEWELLERALDGMSDDERSACLQEAHRLEASVREHGAERRCQCPFFDGTHEACRVYEARPLACRSYGFYAGRSHDAWCTLVEAHVAEVRDTLVLGNLDALESELTRSGGERRGLLDWLRSYRAPRAS